MHHNYCTRCGAALPAGAVFCAACGAPVGQPQVVNHYYVNQTYYPGVRKDKWVAFLLCFFLGFWGVHKFYEGKVGLGILYIFTFGLFSIGWLVDWIVILTKPDPYYV